MSTRNEERFWDELAPIADGDPEAIERNADLLGESDEHRDARFEAQRVAGLLKDAGADYEPKADLADAVLAKIDARGGSEEKQATGEAAPPPPAADPSTTGARPKPEPEKKAETAEPKKKSSGVKIFPLFTLAAAAAAFIAIVAGVVSLVMNRGEEAGPSIAANEAAWTGTLARIARASSDSESGVTVKLPGAESETALTAGAVIPAGATLRTDERTRARIELSEGTVIALDHATEITLDATAPRRIELAGGALVADVAHLDNAPNAEIVTPTGRVEVIGTKFILAATEENASVRVTRGAVRIHPVTGGSAEVKAGNEGLMPKSGEATVSPAVHLAQDIAWSELEAEQQGEDEPIPGLGELRARRPGEREDRERPLHLANHKVTVRVVGNVARTEIEETFRNDDDATLEGIYRFPLPPDARIASLSLEVDGRWEEGAFVDKDRARRIWRGVIRNATPEQQRVDEEEFIWVPGPWRDPALLEWQRGGRFELRIFPIPARGERRIRLAYTQTITPHGREGRRYTYPLAHASDESTRVGRFEVDVRVAGDEATPHGYEMQSTREDNATSLRYVADNFLPKGDLIVDYQLPGGESELRAWTFKGDATVPPADNSREGNPDVVRLQRELDGDDRGYVVFALRPELPAWAEGRSRDYVLVVDSSQSMVGERYDRAVQLAKHMVGEMDRRDRFMVLTCDATCREMSDAPASPSVRAAAQVEGWLSSIAPAGSSNVQLALREAVASLEGKRNPDRDVRVIYIGDGAASVGHRRASSLAAEARALTDDPQVTFTTVGIGGDADTMALEAVARGGGGHYVPYVPGQRASMAALAVLETTYGASLASASLELPEGITDVSPAELPTIRAGEEIIVVGRMASGQVRGEVRLHGKVAGREFTDRYPVSLDASTAAGNAFVPRLWASETIEKLELEGRGENRDRIVAMSKAFGVLSPHTSLLVLESEAMFRAFGVDRNQPTLQWTGEEDMEVSTSTGLEVHDSDDAMLDMLGDSAASGILGGARGRAGEGAGAGFASRGEGGGGGLRGPAVTRERRARRASPRRTAPSSPRRDMPVTAGDEEAEAPAAEPEPVAQSAPADDRAANAEQSRATGTTTMRPPPPRPGGQWMRRVWYREADVNAATTLPPAWQRAVDEAEAQLRANPDSRDRHKALVRALSRAGLLDRAREIAEDWIERDRLDPEALTYLSDVLGRQGKREEAMRYLSGIVDLASDDVTLQERLANAFDRAGMPERACAHRVALAEIQASDAAKVAAAVRCERGLGREEAATRILANVPDAAARQRAEEEAQTTASPERVRGDLILDASWSGGTDVDLSLITPQGTRISWMGGRTTVVGEDASRAGRERLGLRRTSVGSYVVEVNRANPGDTTPITGTINVRVSMNGTLTERRIPFTLSPTDARTTAGRVDIVRRSRMVPM